MSKYRTGFTLLIFVVILPVTLAWRETRQSSKFKQTYGGKGYDAARSIVILDNSEGYLVGGVSSSQSKDGNLDGNVMRLNSSGQIVWNKTLGGQGSEQVKRLLKTKDNHIIIVGHTDSDDLTHHDERIDQTNLNKIWVSKMDLAGNVLWSKTYPDVGTTYQASSGIITREGNILVIGSALSLLGKVQTKIYLLCIDQTGKILWQKTYAKSLNQEGVDVIETENGYTVLCNIEGKRKWDIWLFQIDTLRKPVWQNTFGGGDNEKANKLLKVKAGGYVIGGYTYSFAKGSLDGWLIRTDNQGKENWNQVFGGLSTDEIHSLIETKTGNFMAVGYSEPWESNEDGENICTSATQLFITHVDSKGNSLWQKTWGGEGDQCAVDITPNQAGYSLAGFTHLGDERGIDILIMSSQTEDFSF